MRGLLALSRLIDRINWVIGRQVSWLILVAVLVSAGNAVVRKAFDISSNAWLELQWYLFGTVFMLAAAYALQRNDHVRIDILANRLSKRTRDWIDLLGHTFFLLPFAGLIVWLCLPWFMRSFVSGEHSSNVGGLIIWPAKLMALLGFSLLFLQAISEIIKRLAVILDMIPDPLLEEESEPAELAAGGKELMHD